MRLFFSWIFDLRFSVDLYPIFIFFFHYMRLTRQIIVTNRKIFSRGCLSGWVAPLTVMNIIYIIRQIREKIWTFCLRGVFIMMVYYFIFFFKIRGKNERRLFGLVKWIFHEFRDFANIILCVYTVKPQIIWMLIKVLKYFSSQEWGVIFWMKKSALYKHFPHFISFFYCPRAFHYSNHLTFPSHYGLVKMFPFHVISLVVLAACLQTENGMKNLCNIYFARWKNSFLVTVD